MVNFYNSLEKNEIELTTKLKIKNKDINKRLQELQNKKRRWKKKVKVDEINNNIETIQDDIKKFQELQELQEQLEILKGIAVELMDNITQFNDNFSSNTNYNEMLPKLHTINENIIKLNDKIYFFIQKYGYDVFKIQEPDYKDYYTFFEAAKKLARS